MNIYLTSFNSQYILNGQSGMQLGQGVSSVLGDGTISGANLFNQNGEDGLKITQSSGPYLAGQNIWTPQFFNPTLFQYVTRRQIEANTNFFRNNTGDGIDIGHFALTEGGNVEHGDEVITDVHVSIDNAEISGNEGDGIEYLADSTLRISPIVGGGQDVEYSHRSSLSVTDSRVVSNDKRGIDILNRRGEDSTVSIVNNEILSNGFEGIYVLNTASDMQLQGSSSDPLVPYLETNSGSSDDFVRYFSVGTVIREVHFGVSPNIELRVQDNRIESNGSVTQTSTVPINVSNNANNATGVVNPDWTHQFRQVPGTLGGLVIRVGAADSVGELEAADPESELSLSGVDAEVYRNSFDGNIGADVYFDSFTSQIPAQSIGNLDGADDPDYRWDLGYRDPLSRFDLVFRENSGNSLDVINGFAFLDNHETEFKSRAFELTDAPNHGHNPPTPRGPFSHTYDRFRNQTRTIGYFNSVGNVPGSQAMNLVGLPFWSYDGWGTPTWRVESDFDFNNFTTSDPTLGFSDFFDVTNLGISLAEEQFQWDTGRNVPGFTGVTPYSLNRGDVFNVRNGQAPIAADSLENNDSFLSAHDLGKVAGAGYSVNSQATNNTLSIEKKGDRDYFRFTAAGTGAIDLNLNATDAQGDRLYFMLYEVVQGQKTQEVPLLKNANGTAQFVSVAAGASGQISATVVAGRQYIIEVLGNEAANLGSPFSATTSKPFVYGTARTYGLSIDAPAAPPGGASGPIASGAGSGAFSGGSVSGSPSPVESGGAGAGASGASIPGARPTAAFVAVSPDPRSTSAGGVTLNFTEDVNGVDIADFTLTRNGVNVPLTAGMMTRINASRYFFNLSTNTAAAGTYVLTLKASGSGILDSENLAMLANATETWVTTTAVNTVADTPDTNLGDRLSRDVNGRVSLRASVMESNQVPHLDEIQLGAGQYFLSQLGRFEDDAVTGDLDIKGSTTIRGVSAAATIILGADIDRIFHVFPRAVLTLENLTIRGGEAFDGGAIFNEGTVILRNVNVLDNEAFNQGGGIFNAPNAVLNVFGSSIDTNIAGSRGGGVNNLGSTTYLNTTIARNVAISRGGGIFNEGSATASLINVTLAGNTAASRGAGLASEGSRTSTLGNSIIEANVTVARIPVNGATINRDLMGVVISRGNNFIQVLDSRSTTAATAGLLTSDKFGRDAAPFATLTSALARGASNGVGYRPLIPGRAAVDGGSNSVYPSSNLLAQKDAIGNPRLIEGNSDGLITIDAGAVEHLVNTPVAIFTATPNPAAFGDRVSFDGRGSTHPNPAVGTIVLWEWDYDFNATNGFIPRLTGSTTSRIYPSSAKTNYEVMLRVTDNFGNFGFYSRNIIIGKPTTPVIDRPAAARPGVKPVTTDLTPTFRWTADPATYDLELFRITSTGKVPVFPLVSMTTKTYTPTTPLTMGEYELIVTSRNNTFSSPSAPYRFIVGGMSGLAPTGNTFDLTPKFQWGAVIGSSKYELKVRRVLPTVVEGVINEASISDTSFEPTTSLGLGKFEWQVRAYDIDGVAGAWSSVQTLTIGHIAMTTPGPVTVDTTPTFTWTNMDNGQGTTKYEFWLNRIGGQTKVIVESALTTTTYTPTTPIPNGTYDAWVRPLSPDGEGGLWSYTRRFVMDYRVGPVTYAPVGVSTDTTPTFRWQAADGASSYNLWVDNLSTGVQKTIFVTVPHQANSAQISYTPTVALTAGNYRWWVQTVAPSGLTTSYSAGTDFTVPVPSVISPRGSIATNLPLFRWSGVTGYVSYEIWVDNVTSGAKEVLRVKGITTTSYQSTLPLENGNFKVWIRGYDKDGNISQWSGPADFTVTVGVGVAPILTNSFSNTNGTRTFNWSAGTGAFSYEIIIKRISDPGQPVVLNQTGITGTTFTSPSSFTSGTYRWWIRGLDADGNGLPWSQPLQFFVQTIETVPADVSEIALAATTPVVFDASAGFWSDDVVRSITATPAGTVVQIDPMSVTPEPMTERSVVVEDIAGIDDVMGEWASLNMADAGSQVVPVAVPMIKTSVVSVEKSEPENENRALDLLMAGMALGAVVSKVRKSKDQQ